MNKDREGIVWGLMTDAETSELQFVERDGKSVEEYDGTSWRKMTDVRFLRHKAYRVVPSRQGKCKTCENCNNGDNASDCDYCRICWNDTAHPNWQRKTEKAVELPEEISENKVLFMPELVEKYNKLIKYLKAKEVGK